MDLLGKETFIKLKYEFDIEDNLFYNSNINKLTSIPPTVFSEWVWKCLILLEDKIDFCDDVQRELVEYVHFLKQNPEHKDTDKMPKELNKFWCNVDTNIAYAFTYYHEDMVTCIRKLWNEYQYYQLEFKNLLLNEYYNFELENATS